jgi:hypothetical protein
VIGGLLVSTLLSLLIVPALFTIMDDFGNLCWRLFHRVIGAADASKSAHMSSIAVKNAHDEPIAESGTRTKYCEADTDPVRANVALAKEPGMSA